MRLAALLMIPLVFGLGCTEDDDQFGGGGSSVPGGSGDGGDGAGDGGDGGDGGSDTGLPDDGTPYIQELSMAFDDYPNIGTVIEARLSVYDSDTNLQGGSIDARLDENGELKAEGLIDIDGTNAYLEEGDIIFALGDVSEASSYSLTVTVTDADGNASNQASGSLN